MDLTFVDVFEKYGLDAPVDSFANAFAHAGYMLWHANQAGRYNILHGIKAPQSGYWKNNPHADCIDSVSYTHLRAHETPEHLVCRLLLEKKKNNKTRRYNQDVSNK